MSRAPWGLGEIIETAAELVALALLLAIVVAIIGG